jgi:hypothetical protein
MYSQSQIRARSPLASEASFVVGLDKEGHWLAVETHGLGGGLFTSKEAAIRYASFETGRRAGAVAVVAEPITLRL